MKFAKLIIIGFCTITVIYAAFILKLFKTDKLAFYKISIKESVKEIYTVRGRPLQRSAKLNDGTLIDVPSEFIPYIQSGDSIIKESNSSHITLISFFQDKRTVFIHS